MIWLDRRRAGNVTAKHCPPTYRNKSEQIAEALTGRILNSGLKPGDMPGTEAELLADYDVSRPTLRESLRMLQAQGVVALWPGPGPGPGPGGGVAVGAASINCLAHAWPHSCG